MPQRSLGLVKRQFSLTELDFKWLLEESLYLGISVSELVRRAVTEKRERTQANFSDVVRRARR